MFRKSKFLVRNIKCNSVGQKNWVSDEHSRQAAVVAGLKGAQILRRIGTESSDNIRCGTNRNIDRIGLTGGNGESRIHLGLFRSEREAISIVKDGCVARLIAHSNDIIGRAIGNNALFDRLNHFAGNQRQRRSAINDGLIEARVLNV